jgi:hypothetical protein
VVRYCISTTPHDGTWLHGRPEVGRRESTSTQGCTCSMGENPTYASCVRTLTRRFSTRCYTSICKKCRQDSYPSKDDSESVKCVGAGSRRHCIISLTRAHDERYATNSQRSHPHGNEEDGYKDTCLTVIDTNQVSVNNMRITCDDATAHKHTDHAS